MCPTKIEDSAAALAKALADPRQLSLLSADGSPDSSGATGEPSPSASDAPPDAPETTPTDEAGGTVVRLQRGRSSISAGFLHLTEDAPATFVVLKREGLDGFMVTLSSVMTSSQYGALISTLETTLSADGTNASVGVNFVPTTPNLVQPDTAPNT